ncbi:helix-turn-helix transcriptional regulator [Legionella sp. W05-934-2]|jgi:DNA-binding CsgD family transcriptional regulator|uniref:helix-turn-helix transcriptional regulator n=1 Tax=Legionella sp. W05-934-2 TaxID=1198649 RepID=UPI003461AE79
MKKCSLQAPFIKIDEVDNLINSCPQKIIFLKDKNSRYIIGNELYAQKYGFRTVDEFKGLTDKDLNPRHNRLYLNDDQAVVKTLRPKNIYNPAYYPIHGDVFVEGNIAPVVNNNEEVVGLLGMIEIKEHLLAGSFLSVLRFICDNNLGKYLRQNQYEINSLQIRISKNELVCYFYSQLLNLSTKQVSQLVNLSPRTVEKYIERVRDKRAELPVHVFNELIQQLILDNLS